MRIEHIAVWVSDLEKMRSFYHKYFKMKASEKYVNSKKNFSSYFLTFEGGKTRIEIMHNSEISKAIKDKSLTLGLTHLAISVGNKEIVDELTEKLRTDGFTIAGEPRTTGDGYYESVVLDPEGNSLEITE
jgi:lactoylglutathione lyase